MTNTSKAVIAIHGGAGTINFGGGDEFRLATSALRTRNA